MTIILVHGGAANLAPDICAEKQAATKATTDALDMSLSALDLVEAAVAAQELQDTLNAGIGSVVQMDGHIRMDAGICDSTGRYAAVVQIEDIATPIKVARRLLDIGYHSILSGAGAQAFAREQGFPETDPSTPQTRAAYEETRKAFPQMTYAALTANIEGTNAQKLSTVGAVALDSSGQLAAACSTGGTNFCFPGRVGDTPFLGAGLYASEYVAVACTGEGDKILRRLTARRVEDEFLKHGSLQKAAEIAVQDMMEKLNGYCGLIAVAHTGETAAAYNTQFMAHTIRSE